MNPNKMTAQNDEGKSKVELKVALLSSYQSIELPESPPLTFTVH